MILIALPPWRVHLRSAARRYQSLYRRKKRLMQAILEAVGPGLKRSVAGRAADMVLHLGVPWIQIELLLALQRQIRSSSFDGAKIFERGLRRIAAGHGIAWHDDATGKPYWKLGGKS